MEKIRLKYPNLLCWTWQTYGKHALLLVKDEKPILSQAGVRQSDPMGPFLFCLAIQHILTNVASAGVLSFTYMDDIYLVGTRDKLSSALPQLEESLSLLSLQINFAKSYSTSEVSGLSQPLKVKGPPQNPKVMKSPSISEIPSTPSTTR